MSVLWDAVLAALAVLVGALILAAPWAVRLWGDFRREQDAAVRATERADIAAHLHDSVLQTLALIQRQSADPAAVTRLARAQERELRTWLYDGPQGSQSSLAAAVTEVAHEVEDLHGVPVDLVVTGDRPFEQHGAALSRAMREALLNAVRHGSPPVTAYVEIGPAGVEAFVRDRGRGLRPRRRPRVTASASASRSSAGWNATAARRGSAGARTAPRWSSGSRRSKEKTHDQPGPHREDPRPTDPGRPRRRPSDVPHRRPRRAHRGDGRRRPGVRVRR